MKHKINRFKKIYPIYDGLSGDLMFFTSIDTLFLAIVKHLSVAQIVSFTTVSCIFSLLTQFIILKIIKKIGNELSVKVGITCLLLASLLITFGPNYYIILIGLLFRRIAFKFKDMDNIILKNNLKSINEADLYINIKNKSNIYYAFITAVLALISGFLFNVNNYLPMYMCILNCYICLILTVFIKDYSNKNNEVTIENKNKLNFKSLNKILIYSILIYSLAHSVISLGQDNSKLIIQDVILTNFDAGVAAVVFGAVIAISRVARIIGNLSFMTIYKKFKKYISVILAFLLLLAIAFVITGFLIKINIVFRIIVMSLGFIIILAIRDPYSIFTTNTLLENSEEKDQQTILGLNTFINEISITLLSFLITLLLLKVPLIKVIILLLVVAYLSLIISFKFQKMLNKKI